MEEKDVKAPEEMIGIKLSPSFRKELTDYLDTRPMIEVENFFTGIFDKGDDVFILQDAFQAVTDYLQKSCPRKDIKPLIAKILNGKDVQAFKLTPKQEENQTQKQ